MPVEEKVHLSTSGAMGQGLKAGLRGQMSY